MAEVRALLPVWVGWCGAALYVCVALATSVAASALAVRLALGKSSGASRPMHGSAAEHWSEEARRSFPARVTSSLCVIVMPVTFGVLAQLSVGPLSRLDVVQVGAMAAAAALLGATVVHWRLLRRVLPDPPSFRYWLAGAMVLWVAIRPGLVVLVVMGAAAPLDLVSVGGAVWLALLLGLNAASARGLGIWLLHPLGLARPPSERLSRIVDEAATTARVEVRRIHELRWPMVNAVAYPGAGVLAFSDAALAHLSDDELGAVAAHELGHLAEPASAILVRYSQALILVPLAALRPIYHALGLEGLFAALIGVLLLTIPLRRFSQRMEKHADEHAHHHGDDDGAYARALAKLYRINAIPAVLSAQTTHPHLYDRLTAAGAVPSFPRPSPPPRRRHLLAFLAGFALVFATLVALLFAPWWALDAEPSDAQLHWSLAMRGSSRELGLLGDRHLARREVAAAVTFYRAAVALSRTPVFEVGAAASALVAHGRCVEAKELLVENEAWLEREDSELARQSLDGCR